MTISFETCPTCLGTGIQPQAPALYCMRCCGAKKVMVLPSDHPFRKEAPLKRAEDPSIEKKGSCL